jgi:ketosteroid isomerase-like protein
MRRRRSRVYFPSKWCNRTLSFRQVHAKKFTRGSWLETASLFYAGYVRLGIATMRPEFKIVKKNFLTLLMLLSCAGIAVPRPQSLNDDGGWVLGLEKAWNHALEAQDAKALDMILANTFVSIDIDGSLSSKGEFLASIKSPDYQPSQAVTEQSKVDVYGNSAVVVGVFRVKGLEKGKPYVHRERFVDTWIKTNGTWQCVATTSTLITAKQGAE